MPESFSKARIFLRAVADAAIDLSLPTAIYYLLTPTHLSAIIRLTIGGYFVAAKASAGHVSTDEGKAQPSDFARAFAIGATIATVATAVTLGVRASGFSDAAAIGSGTVLLAAVQGGRLIRNHRRLDGLAVLVLLELAATIILTAISSSPRFLLIRPSFYTAIAGFYVLSRVWSDRPFMMQASKPMATAGDPVRAAAFERAARESLRFRRAEQGMTAGLGIVLLGEAILRVWTVWSHPESDVLVSSLQSQVWGVGLLVAWFAVVRLVFVPTARREVDRFMPAATLFEESSPQKFQRRRRRQ
jgi:hypothetical protein